MHRTVAAALLAVLALGAASCGGSQKTLTGAELVRQIEVACREGQQQMQRQQQRSPRGTGSVATMHFLEAVIAGQRAIDDRIKDIDGSGAAKADFDTFKQAMQQRLALFQRVQSGGAAHVQSAIRSAQAEGEAISRKLQDTTTRLGVRGCG